MPTRQTRPSPADPPQDRGGSAPVVEYKKPLAWPSAVSQMSTNEFIAAMTAVEPPRPPPRPPQPANAVFNDAQIASMKDRLELTEEQQPYWQAVEASLREVAWDRSRGIRPRLESSSLEAIKAGSSAFRCDAQRQAAVQDRAARQYRRTAAQTPRSMRRCPHGISPHNRLPRRPLSMRSILRTVPSAQLIGFICGANPRRVARPVDANIIWWSRAAIYRLIGDLLSDR